MTSKHGGCKALKISGSGKNLLLFDNFHRILGISSQTHHFLGYSKGLHLHKKERGENAILWCKALKISRSGKNLMLVDNFHGMLKHIDMPVVAAFAVSSV